MRTSISRLLDGLARVGQGRRGDVAGLLQPLGAVKRLARRIEGDIGPVERHLLVGGIEPDENLAGGDLGAGREIDRGDDPRHLGVKRHRTGGGRGADRAYFGAESSVPTGAVTTSVWPKPPGRPPGDRRRDRRGPAPDRPGALDSAGLLDRAEDEIGALVEEPAAADQGDEKKGNQDLSGDRHAVSGDAGSDPA